MQFMNIFIYIFRILAKFWFENAEFYIAQRQTCKIRVNFKIKWAQLSKNSHTYDITITLFISYLFTPW